MAIGWGVSIRPQGQPPLTVLLLGAANENRAEDADEAEGHADREPEDPLTKLADVLVAAVGREKLITAEMVKPGACVIDVGVNRTADGELAGDVDFAAVKEIAGSITPVPGGVGPMTVAMLIVNTVQAAEQSLGGARFETHG